MATVLSAVRGLLPDWLAVFVERVEAGVVAVDAGETRARDETGKLASGHSDVALYAEEAICIAPDEGVVAW